MVKYFSTSDTGHDSVTRTADQIFPFTFIDKNSEELLVTIGDSWTWGDDITPDNNETNRLACVFGNILSTQLNSDWLNLGQCGSGNFWLVDRVTELAAIIPQLQYKKIYVVCTLTEVGREFNSTFDRNIDYIAHISKFRHYDTIFELLNTIVVDQIVNMLQPFSNVTLRIGTNFVDQIGLSGATDCLLAKPWVSLLCGNLADRCYVVGSRTIDNFKRSIDLFPDSNTFLNWIILITKTAIQRKTMLQTNQFRNGHPLANGHQRWADYIMQSL